MRPDLSLRVPSLSSLASSTVAGRSDAVQRRQISCSSPSGRSGAALLLILSHPDEVARGRAWWRGGCAASLRPAGRGGGGAELWRTASSSVGYPWRVGGFFLFLDLALWWRWILAELKLCCPSGSLGSISPAAAATCSLAPSGINGCRESSPTASLAEQVLLSLLQPKWHAPRRWRGGRSWAASSVAWR
jgi:hypothetical protein